LAGPETGTRSAVNPTRLDHVALYVSDPSRVAAALLARLPLRILEETDEFVLVGRKPELGKLTLFGAPGPREPGELVRIGMAVPCAMASSSVDLGEELSLELVPGPRDGEVDLDHVALRVQDARASVRGWLELGFEQMERIGQVERVRLGDAVVELHPGTPTHTDHPLLNHIGLLVESADEARADATDAGLEIRRVVEAEHSRAVFVTGPDGVEVELIEQLPSFALV
jgi:catechol 2,3-dioxygenase-like lactoylglutathione lyase family enzyme